LTLIEGPTVLEEAIGSGTAVEVVFGDAADEISAARSADSGIEWVPVTGQALQRLAGTKTPRGPVAVISIPRPAASLGEARVLVAWAVSDPGNMGTMVRTAASFGWQFGYSPGTADPWSPKAIRAGAGAHFRTPVLPVTDMEALGSAGLTTIATVVEGGIDPSDVPAGLCAVLIGTEAHGLPTEVVAACEIRSTIPMPGGFESLNATAAAAITVYALNHRRPS
jgi:TrmH family RNA methyltransferase